ncbi:hypothetical protein JRC04_27165 [Mycolicibacterium sp. S2-37]|uniref:hypothetical protein n=1 Tax=Mycolicibacterium sp. S2-37 TaxID=2810297 RepID=UPI001A94F64A|nr:hypothetical protein [Mycolicibacterium sp. S2-37]MBO0681158.1 hypothetical protein [Mycolicibacterium sp. S2-37]
MSSAFVALVSVLVFVASTAVSALAYVVAAWAVQRATGGAVSWTAAAAIAAVAGCACMALVLAAHR